MTDAKKSQRPRHRHLRHEHEHLVSYEELLAKPERITVEDLKQMMDEGKNPLILDVRNPHDYEESEIKIEGSVRIPAPYLHSLIDKLPVDRPIVPY
jgi:hypothetical protein